MMRLVFLEKLEKFYIFRIILIDPLTRTSRISNAYFRIDFYVLRGTSMIITYGTASFSPRRPCAPNFFSLCFELRNGRLKLSAVVLTPPHEYLYCSVIKSDMAMASEKTLCGVRLDGATSTVNKSRPVVMQNILENSTGATLTGPVRR